MEIIRNMPNKEYHATDGLSKSKMDKIAISPAHYKEDLEEIFEEDAKDDFWDTCGAEIEAGLKAEYEDYQYEINKERREL